MDALHDTYIFPIATTGVALVATLFIENKNIKEIDRKRQEEGNQREGALDPNR